MGILFELGPREARVRRLSEADPHFAELAGLVGPITVSTRADAFDFLARSLISQQLSVKAADTITGRLERHCGSFSPDAMLATGRSWSRVRWSWSIRQTDSRLCSPTGRSWKRMSASAC